MKLTIYLGVVLVLVYAKVCFASAEDPSSGESSAEESSSAPGICESSPCLNNGTCVDNENGTFTCICESGFKGTICIDLEVVEPCSSGWYLNAGSCYLFSTEVKTWQEARDDCIARGAHLAEIHSLEENNFLIGYVAVSYWIGLNDIANEGQFVWTGSESSVTFEGFKASHNDMEEDKDCVYVELFHWYSASCNKNDFYICEADAAF